jgi:hypothetical protein
MLRTYPRVRKVLYALLPRDHAEVDLSVLRGVLADRPLWIAIRLVSEGGREMPYHEHEFVQTCAGGGVVGEVLRSRSNDR